MRIALVSDAYLPRLGGIELHVRDLAVQLRLAGHRVTVFTLTDGPAEPGDPPVVRFPGITWLPTATESLHRSLRSGEYDVVHAHTSLLSPLAWSATRVAADLGVPAIITMHSLPAAGGVLAPWLLNRLDRGFGPRLRWTAVSEVVAESLREALPDRPIEVLHNGIDPTLWRRPEPADHVLTLVSTMRLAHRKRPAALLRTLREIRAKVPAAVPLRAVVVGSGPQARMLARSIRRAGMTWVELPGRLTRPQIQRLYSTADVYLAPAELESFGVAALEARCAGLAVVAMASGGVREFVRPGVEGFLVDSHRAMAEVTTELLTTPPLLRKVQDHNRFTEPAMTWEAVVARHLRLYRTQLALSAGFLPSKERTSPRWSWNDESARPTEPAVPVGALGGAPGDVRRDRLAGRILPTG